MIHRCKRPTRYTIVNNKLIEDETLSLPALGLLVYLLHKPDDWEVYPKYLATKLYKKKNSKAGYRYILELINELEEHGYCKKTKHSDGSVDYYIYDEPNAEIQHYPNAENIQQAEPNAEIPHYPNAEKPHAEIPHHIINTNLITNTNSLSSSNKLNDTYFFDTFWEIYPRKSNKAAAKKKFNRLSAKKQKEILLLTRYFANEMKDKAQEYIPMATTYLNQERYLDYVQENLSQKSNFGQPKEGAEFFESSESVGSDVLSGKILKLVEMYRETDDDVAANALNLRAFESFMLAKEGAAESMFSDAELKVLQEVGADIKDFSELEWQEGEIKRLLRGYVC